MVAFGFSRGQFSAVTEHGTQYYGLHTQTIDEHPRPTSANYLFHSAAVPAFVVDLKGLALDPDWYDYLRVPQSFLQIGSVYNGVPSRYYRDLELTSYARQL